MALGIDVVACPRTTAQRDARRVARADHDARSAGGFRRRSSSATSRPGASNDFEKATELARRMVTQYGMSELGPIQYGRGAHQVFLGRDFGDERNYSEEIASKIDAQVRTIIETCYENGKQILNKNWDKVDRMVASLLEYETVDAEEVAAILAGKPYDRVAVESVLPVEGDGERAVRGRAQTRRKAGASALRRSHRNRHDAGCRSGRGRDARVRIGALCDAVYCQPTRCSSSEGRCRAAGRTCSIPIRPSELLRSRCGFARRERATTTRRRASRGWRRRPRRLRRWRAENRSFALVHSVGGELNINVYPDIVGIGAHRAVVGGAPRGCGNDGRILCAAQSTMRP